MSPRTNPGSPAIRLAVICSTLIGTVVLVTPRSHAEWAEDGVPVSSAWGDQEYPQIVTDGANGAIVFWQDSRSGSSDIYAQRVDHLGNPRWTPTGVAVCTADGDQRDIMAVPDGSGGAIITWNDDRNPNYDIFAQRVSASGVVQWEPEGVPVCLESETQMHSVIATDGAGGAIIAWEDYRSAYPRTYAQRVGAGGTVAWTPGGVLICNLAVYQYHPRIIADGEGGAFVTWSDDRSGSPDIIAQRIDANGASLWSPNGIVVCSANGTQYAAEPASDGMGGILVTWIDGRPTTQGDIYVQRISADGSALWMSNGVPVCVSTQDEMWPEVTSDGDGGAIVVWQDERLIEFTSLYARRVNRYGEVLWAEDGIGLSEAPGDHLVPRIVSDGTGGAIVTWTNWNVTPRVRLQRVNALGRRLWGTTGLAASPGSPGVQFTPTLVPDDRGGVVVAWMDSRTGTYDIYAQEIDARGFWGHPAPAVFNVRDVPNDQGGFVTLSWARSSRDRWPSTTVTHYSVWRSLSEAGKAASPAAGEIVLGLSEVGRDFRGRACLPLLRNGTTYWWEWVANADAHYLDDYSMTVPTVCDSVGNDACRHHFFVAAHTDSVFVFWDSEPDSGCSVDNLSPARPAALAGELSLNPAGLRLFWHPNAEPDLSNYLVYRGLIPDFIPAQENLLASPADTTYLDPEWRWDSGYHYKVSAVDVHRNESGHALLRPEDLIGQGDLDAPVVPYLSQNFPNPCGPSTRIGIGLRSRATLRLEIFDVSGRVVRTLVDECRPAGSYIETWDGRDGGGRALPSGLYSIRLTTGSVTRTIKAVLIR